MLFRANSDGLELFQQAIEDNKHMSDQEALEQFIHAYKVSNEEVIETDNLYDTIEDAIIHIDKLKDEIVSADQKIDDLFNNSNDDTTIEEFFIDVCNVLENVEIKEFDYDQKESEESKQYRRDNEIEKMVKLGYRFEAGQGRAISDKADKEKHAMITEKRLKAIEVSKSNFMIDSIKKFTGETILKDFKAKKIDDNRYEVYSYRHSIDAIYCATKNKVTGKGSRKYKEDLLKFILHYIELEKQCS